MAFTGAKIKITGTIELKTGLHIGGDTSFSAIGAIDSPAVRDPLSREPIIPGSTIKGKLRTLLARYLKPESMNPNNDPDEILRLFGSSKQKLDGEMEESGAPKTEIRQSRLMFKDAFLTNKEKLPQIYETKFENTINRLTAEANPRQIERVVRGAKFDLEIIYNIEDPDDVSEDFTNLQTAFELLRNDYLGGGGTRGNGRVEISIQDLKQVSGKNNIETKPLCEIFGLQTQDAGENK